MPLKNDRYTYRVTWSEDDQEYAGLCTDQASESGRSYQLPLGPTPDYFVFVNSRT